MDVGVVVSMHLLDGQLQICELIIQVNTLS